MKSKGSAQRKHGAADAALWREEVCRRAPALAGVLNALEGEALTRAYTTWWAAYSRGIRDARSNRLRQGVSTGDAQTAVADADATVITGREPHP